MKMKKELGQWRNRKKIRGERKLRQINKKHKEERRKRQKQKK